MSTEKDNADQNSAKRIALRALEIASSTQANQNAAAGGSSVINSGAVVAGASIVAPSAADFAAQAPKVVSSTSKRVLLSGSAFVRHSAVDTAITCQYVRDPAGANTAIGPIMTVDSSHVNANALASIAEFYDTPGAGVRVYALRIATAAGTVTILAANEAMITATPVQ
jgi:hypothetical protein